MGERMTRYVLYNDAAGIFLGDFLGFGYWSKWNTGGKTHAIVFPDEETAFVKFQKLDPQCAPTRCCTLLVECADTHATIEECVAAGLPAWWAE